jgi:hypothetical protein
VPDFLDFDELKRRLHVTFDDDDAELQGYLDAAQSYLADPENGILRRPVVAQEFTEVFAGFGCVDLAFPDDARDVSVAYIDSSGLPQTLGPIYTIHRGQLVLAIGSTWPHARGPVTVTYTAGWNEAEVPDGIREAGYFIARSYYEQGDEIDVDRFRSVVAFKISGFRRATL